MGAEERGEVGAEAVVDRAAAQSAADPARGAQDHPVLLPVQGQYHYSEWRAWLGPFLNVPGAAWKRGCQMSCYWASE